MDKTSNTDIMSSINTEDVDMDISDSDSEICLLDTIMTQNNNTKKYIIVEPEKRVSKNKLTRYELVRIIGERTKQLTMGAKPLVKQRKGGEQLNYNEIAIEEVKLNMVPFKIKRPVGNHYEIWSLEELDKSHLADFLY